MPSVYEVVTEKIIKQLESGVPAEPCRKDTARAEEGHSASQELSVYKTRNCNQIRRCLELARLVVNPHPLTSDAALARSLAPNVGQSGVFDAE
jgi:hypothetical protein